MKKVFKTAIPTVALIAGFAVSTGVIASANNKKNLPSSGKMYVDGVEMEHADIDYNVNDSGQSYGSCAKAAYIEDYPDLVSVVGDKGNIGYVYKDEMLGEDPSCPEEAIRMQEEKEKAKANGTYVPEVRTVYAADGKTVIDTFTVGDRIAK